jgi:preprotein translocase subunit YajC
MNKLMTLLPLAQTTTDGAGQSAPNPLVQFMPIILIFVVMYMLLIRPQQKKNKEHQELVKKLKAGDRVVTAGGVHGVISAVKDRSVMVQVAENVVMEFSRTSIITVNPEAKA